MHNIEVIAGSIIRWLKHNGVEPILFGSVGVGLYVGFYKEPDDIDFLVEGIWLDEQWKKFQAVLSQGGWQLLNEHEHEFTNTRGVKVAFADVGVLERDHICNPKTDLVMVDCGGEQVQTLTLEGFLAAYQFSRRDGYRQSHRAVKDATVIALIQRALSQQQLK